MRAKRLGSVVIIALTMLVSLGAATTQSFVGPADADWTAMLPGPPADDSPEHQAEISTLLAWQHSRTAEDVSRCRSEVPVDVFIFSDVIGDQFKARLLPVTARLFDKINGDAALVSKGLKKHWSRIRPPLGDKRIHPCVPLEATGSYPSGHATRGIVWATILSDIYPDLKDKLFARGRQIGEDRVIAGMHFPSDIEAGQKIGAEIASRLLSDSNFKIELQYAKDECLAGTHN